ncbi:MerR family transcriptional regulator [Eubacteriaceae bacterium ES2]|nr:MerR family transcriptional regulator [Eubacteriaceae bacterium ES2]
MKKLFYNSGEFAALCNTSKETLRHYRQIDLLKPEQIAANGYCRYSDLQVNDFYLIDILKSSGCSLEKIRQIFATPVHTDLRMILEEQLALLLLDKEKLLLKEKRLRQSIEKFKLLGDPTLLGNCHVTETSVEEYFIGTPIASNLNDPAAFVIAQQQHFRYCRDHGFGEEYQLSFLLLHESFLKRDYFKGSYILSRIPQSVKSDLLFIKPAGRYLRLIKPWNPDMAETYDLILNYASEQSLSICGNVYEAEISLYMQGDEGNYFTELMVEIE